MPGQTEIWIDLLKEVGLTVESEELQYIVNHFLTADNIDSAIFHSNYRMLLPQLWSAAEALLRMEDSTKPTPSLLSFEYVENRPRCYPLWFIAAYPDVCRWFQNMMREYLKKHKRDYKGWEMISLRLLRIDAKDPNPKESDLIDENDKYRPTILKNLVRSYKDNTGGKFETRRRRDTLRLLGF